MLYKDELAKRLVRQATKLSGGVFALLIAVAMFAAPPASASYMAPLPTPPPRQNGTVTPLPSGSPPVTPSPSPTPVPTATPVSTPTPVSTAPATPFPSPTPTPTFTPGPVVSFSPLENGIAPSPSAVTPSPSPTPSPTGSPGYVTVKGGRITFSILGNLSFGASGSSSSYGGVPTAAPSATPTGAAAFISQNQSQTTSQQDAGMTVDLNRRTATTVTDLRFPIGLSTGGGATTISNVQAFYSTPKYTIAYSQQPILLFGQLPLGSTLRGVAFIYPTAFGDVTFYEGPITGAEGETIPIFGGRVRGSAGDTYYEYGFLEGDGAQSGQTKTVTFGAATGRGKLSLVAEGAWQERTGGDGSPSGPSVQAQISDGADVNDMSLTVRHVPDYFIAYGSGEIYGDNYADFNVHRGLSGTQDIQFDANIERVGSSPTDSQFLRSDTFLYSGGGKIGSYGFGVSQQASNGGGQDIATSTASAQASFNIDSLETILTGQDSREVSTGTTNSIQATRLLSLALQRTFGKWGLVASSSALRTTQTGGDPASETTYALGATRLFGKSSITLVDTVTRSTGDTTDAISNLPLISVSRQISPAVSTAVSFGYQTLRDKLNPESDGHSRVFNFTINAPFSFGNNLTTGRTDPRLPATITGRVQNAASGTGPLAGFAATGPSGGGISNVVVILDNKYLQRTDLTGDFEFSFVTAGQHQLRIESSSIPRGLTVDQPVATITLQGGQTTNILFQVGNFGGITGHVYGLDASGNQLPLQNVQLRLNGGTYAQTDTTGSFGFGGLQAGSYDVEIIENTIPAFADFDPSALKQKIQVRNGSYTKVNFEAQPLGSIAGTVLYGPEMLPDYKGGVPNVYVVAEPGEHAAINDDDGSYIIDNLPPGDYTVSVDPETLPEALGSKPESLSIKVLPGQHVTDVNFTAGRFEKKVVFSFLGGNAAGAIPIVRLRETRLPPNGTTEVLVTAPESAKSVAITTFNNAHVALTYDKSRKEWVGRVDVPADAKDGDYPIQASAASGTQPTGATLTIDTKMPIAILSMTPNHAPKGTYVTVRARFLTDVSEGDKIQWEDGQTTVLGKPVTGRVFTFGLRVSLRPLHGALLTKRGTLPIVLL
jgi:hypothetical protein